MITRRRFISGAGAVAGCGLAGTTAYGQAELTVLDQAFVRIERQSVGRLGVAVLDVASGAAADYRGDEKFPLCSTFKLLAAATVLKRVDQGKEKLDRRIMFTAGDLVTYSPATEKHVDDGMTLAGLCEAAITLSDNTAGNLLLANIGGPAGLTGFARSLGDTVTRLDRIEPDLNQAIPGDPRDTTTPKAMIGNIRKLVLGTGLSNSSKKHLTAWLLDNKTGAGKLRAGLPEDWRVGDKTGSGERGTTNEVGVIWPSHGGPIVFAIYLTETSATIDRRNATLAAVGQALADAVQR
ncbi:MAG: class A beta-lactamase [Rhizobiales bacterium]|jgi:beta-lactamase class A|nr:class A beta-lactamase [Hyphomicrobiales bacterium]